MLIVFMLTSSFFCQRCSTSPLEFSIHVCSLLHNYFGRALDGQTFGPRTMSSDHLLTPFAFHTSFHILRVNTCRTVMATTLPPMVHSPFAPYLHQKPYVVTNIEGHYPLAGNASNKSHKSSDFGRPRQFSTSSIVSFEAGPLQTRNDENSSTLRNQRQPLAAKRATSLRGPQPGPQTNTDGTHKTLRTTSAQSCARSPIIPPKDIPPGFETPTPHSCEERPASERPLQNVGNRRQRLSIKSPQELKTPASSSLEDRSFEELHEEGQQSEEEHGNFKHWANSLRRKKNLSSRTPVRQGNQFVQADNLRREHFCQVQMLPLTSNIRHKCQSDASSGFVRTVKTASLSNASLSLAPRSHKQSHSSDTRGNRSSYLRFSTESDRLMGRASLDEGALCRATKRRQILQEILTSEETYLADLKALCDLFSTLLASVTSLSGRAKSSIQRNLHEMQQLHSDLLDEMHRLPFIETPRSSRKRGAFTLRRPALPSHARRQSLQTHSPQQSMQMNRRQGSSVDSANSYCLLRTIEPSESAEFARIFKHFMARFFVYEEYSSNNEIMLRELVAFQRSIPSWPLYETGIEALSRSIRAIDQKVNGNRRALTVSDLLVAPIQRLTKYPLLFADLYRNTPVIDCPDSHAEVELTLQCLRELVREVNQATDDRVARERIRKRWLLQDRLTFTDEILQAGQFRMLGHPILCGVLHLAYQTKAQVQGTYGLCLLFAAHLVLSIPSRLSEKFDVIAVVHLSNLSMESTNDGRGMSLMMTSMFVRLITHRPAMSYCSFLLEASFRIRQSALRNHPQRMFRHRGRAVEDDHRSA